MTKDCVRALLPVVGEERFEKPLFSNHNDVWKVKPRKCIVVDVNRAHLWYAVRFENGIRETYKVPRLRAEVNVPGGKKRI